MLAPMPAHELPGLGPKSRQMLASAGVHSAAQLRQADLFALYGAIKSRHRSASLNLLYGLIGAVQGRDWRDVARQDRTSVLLRLDELGLLPSKAKATKAPL
jgi:DNA transformation protein and related proteins